MSERQQTLHAAAAWWGDRTIGYLNALQETGDEPYHEATYARLVQQAVRCATYAGTVGRIALDKTLHAAYPDGRLHYQPTQFGRGV